MATSTNGTSAIILDPSRPLIRRSSKNASGSTCWANYPNVPWDISWYFSVRGAESLHLYLWIMKDISWTQDFYVSGFIFGILTVMWSIYILSHAIHHRNIKEIWTCTGQFLWLFANLWWMTGELHDFAYPTEPLQYPQRTIDAGHIMEAALIWLGIYYLTIKPFNIWQPTPEADREYNIKRLKPRFSFFFSTWREYENVHIFFWLGKDLFWNRLNPVMWIIFLVPTILIAMDFVLVSYHDPRLLIEHCHYIAQMSWVLGNMTWAMGEIFFPANDYPYGLFSSDPARLKWCRWYSSWVLVISYIPIIVLYIIWHHGHSNGTYNYLKTWRTVKPKRVLSDYSTSRNISDSKKSNENSLYEIEMANVPCDWVSTNNPMHHIGESTSTVSMRTLSPTYDTDNFSYQNEATGLSPIHFNGERSS